MDTPKEKILGKIASGAIILFIINMLFAIVTGITGFTISKTTCFVCYNIIPITITIVFIIFIKLNLIKKFFYTFIVLLLLFILILINSYKDFPAFNNIIDICCIVAILFARKKAKAHNCINTSAERNATMNMLGSQLENFRIELTSSPSICEKIAMALESPKVNGIQETNKESKIIYLMRLDAQKIYKQLVPSALKYEDDRSAMFSYINYCINNTTANKATTYNAYLLESYSKDWKYFKSHGNILDGINEYNCDKEYKKYLFAYLFRYLDADLRKRYFSLLYRYASVIAKADNKVTESEQAVLQNITNYEKELESLIVADDITITEANKNTVNNNKDVTTSDSSTAENETIQYTKDLDELIGLSKVKEQVSTLVNYIKIQKLREDNGLKMPNLSYHCVFTGNPGTGKTTVARILANIYKDLGIISKGQLVETDRSGLVAEYVGQTAIKTNNVINAALDGVLFIDEAYALMSNSSNDYGQEAISTLLKRMEDERGRLIVILAGYNNEMKEFIASNPGLQSRFNRYIEFEDYSEDELKQIFLMNVKKYQYKIDNEAINTLSDVIHNAVTHKNNFFGNGRWARNLFEHVIERQANRLSSVGNISNDILITIAKEDIEDSADNIIATDTERKKVGF